MEEEELEDGIQSVDSLSSTPTGVETPDVIDLRKQQRKEPERPFYQVLEEKEERIAPGTLLGTTHTYVVGGNAQDKSGAKRVDLLRGQKANKVDVTLLPEEMEAMDKEGGPYCENNLLEMIRIRHKQRIPWIHKL